MGLVQETISVQSEVQAVCVPLVQAAKDIKAKSPTATYVTDGIALVTALMSAYAALAADLQTVEAQAYLGLTLGRIAAAFDGAVPAAA